MPNPAILVKIGVILLGSLQLSCAPLIAASPRKVQLIHGIQVQNGFTESQISLIRQDLNTLLTLEMTGESARRLQERLAIPHSGPEALRDWLAQRVRILLPPQLETLVMPTGEVARNYGAALFHALRNSEQTDTTIWIPGLGHQRLSSPSVGFIQLGEPYFQIHTEWVNSYPGLESIRRLGYLFHEARHSDTPRDTASGTPIEPIPSTAQHAPGYPHVSCPKGHLHEGQESCDVDTTGALGVQSLFLRAAAQACTTCLPEDRALIEDEASQAELRIIYDSNPS